MLGNFEEHECLRCRKMGDIVTEVSPAGCITKHPDFQTVCLMNIAVLRMAYFELRSWGYPMSDNIHK